MSVSEKVASRVLRMKRGTPFATQRFYDLGSTVAVQKALSRMSAEGVITRMSKGFYVRPKPLPSMPSIKVTASADAVARAWAREHGYTLVKQGEEAAYRLGLQTQAPVKTILWSDGPSRTFKVGREVVEVRHTSVQKLRWKERPEGELLRGLSVTPAESVKPGTLRRAFNRLGLTEAQSHEVLKKLKTASLPKAWQQKLNAL